jgi:hypothetical protein
MVEAVTSLCNSLESVLTYFQDNYDVMEDEVGSNIFKKVVPSIHLCVLFFG